MSTSSHAHPTPGHRLAPTKDQDLIFSQRDSLKKALHGTLHRNLKDNAAFLGMSYSYAARSCLSGESGVRFPADLLAPLMLHTNDFTVLDCIASQCGRLTVSVPRARSMKRLSRLKLLLAIESSFTNLMRGVLEYVERPEPRALPEIKRTLRSHLAELSALRLALETYSQKELDF